VFYIDADAIVVSKLPLYEQIFDRDVEFAAAPDVFPPDHFNAGVLFLKPNLLKFSELLTMSRKLDTYDGGDTGLLNNCYPDWYRMESDCRLDYGFNAQRILHWFTIKRTDGYWREVEERGLKIIHYSSSPKPWVEPLKPRGDLEALWTDYFLKMSMQPRAATPSSA
jgi:glycogenin